MTQVVIHVEVTEICYMSPGFRLTSDSFAAELMICLNIMSVSATH
jgi:hypothetical protein